MNKDFVNEDFVNKDFVNKDVVSCQQRLCQSFLTLISHEEWSSYLFVHVVAITSDFCLDVMDKAKKSQRLQIQRQQQQVLSVCVPIAL